MIGRLITQVASPDQIADAAVVIGLGADVRKPHQATAGNLERVFAAAGNPGLDQCSVETNMDRLQPVIG